MSHTKYRVDGPALRASFVILSTMLLAAPAAPAADRYWVGGSTNWAAANTWSATPGGAGTASIPVNGDNAFLGNGSYIVTRDNLTAAYISPGLNSLSIDGAPSLLPQLLQTAGNTMFSQTEVVGGTGIGLYTHISGPNTAAVSMTLGQSSTGVGTYNMSGATATFSTPLLNDGSLGNGVFAQSGGAATITTLNLGSGSTGSGIYNLTGTGTLHANVVNVGTSGSGTFISNVTSGQPTLGTVSIGTGGTGTVGRFSVVLGNTLIGNTTIGPNGLLDVSGGVLSQVGNLTINGGKFIYNFGGLGVVGGGGVLTVANNGTFSVPLYSFQNNTVNLTTGGLYDTQGTTYDPLSNVVLNINGGKLLARGLSLGTTDTINFNYGTLALTSSSIDISSTGPIGSDVTLPNGKSLEVTGTTNIFAPGSLVLNGGTFATGSLNIQGTF